MKTFKFFLTCLLGSLPLVAPVLAHEAEASSRLSLHLPLPGKEFNVTTMEFSAGGERVCIAGDDYDEMGTSAARVLLVDRARNSVIWQTAVAVPADFARLFPVQCIVGNDRVYFLANADTSLSPPQAHTYTYVIAFDMRGKQVASVQLPLAGESRYGYAMDETADGLSVVGYTDDRDEGVEHYATYTVNLDRMLQVRGAPVVRKNGAYVPPLAARIIGDSVFLTGRFFAGTVSKNYLGQFSASKLRSAGGYTWSTPSDIRESMHPQFAISDDGNTYTFGYERGTTILSGTAPDGKQQPVVKYLSAYCRTLSVAHRGNRILAVRRPCTGKGNALLSIDLAAAKETEIRAIEDEPVYVVSKGTAWAVMGRDKTGKLYIYPSMAGEF